MRKAAISFVMSVRPSVRLSVHKEHLGSQWMDFREVRCLSIVQKYVEKIQVPLTFKNRASYI